MPVTAAFVAIAVERFGTPAQYGNAAGTFQRGSALYIVCSNPGAPQNAWNATGSGTPPPILAQGRVLKSLDGGATWAEVDVDNGPQVALQKSGAGFRGLYSPMAACYQDADTLIVAYFVWDYVYNNPVELRFSTFDLITETWGAEIGGGPTSTVVQNLSVAFRTTDNAVVFMYDGIENVAATDYQRVFFVVYDAVFGVETAVDAAQTGSTDNFGIAGCVAGDLGRTHFFYVVPDPAFIAPSVIYQNTLTALDALVGRVQVTDQLRVGNQGGGGGWTYAAPAARLVAGVTQLLIGYDDATDPDLFVAAANSVDSPVFASQNVTTGASITGGPVGVFGAGKSVSQGAAAAMIDTTAPDLQATASRDLATWDTPPASMSPIPFAEPLTQGGLTISSFTGLFIDYASGFYSSGIAVNTVYIPPE